MVKDWNSVCFSEAARVKAVAKAGDRAGGDPRRCLLFSMGGEDDGEDSDTV